MKNWLIGLLVLCGVVFGGSVIAESITTITPYHPDYSKASSAVCAVGWIEGRTYYHETHYSLGNIPNVIPPEGWTPELLWEGYCLHPHGGWLAIRDGFSQETYVPVSRYEF